MNLCSVSCPASSIITNSIRNDVGYEVADALALEAARTTPDQSS